MSITLLLSRTLAPSSSSIPLVRLSPTTRTSINIFNVISEKKNICSISNRILFQQESNQVEGSTNQVKGSSNQVKGSANQVRGSANQVRGSANQVKGSRIMSTLPSLPVPDLETSLNELKLTAGSFASSQEEYTNFCTLVNEFMKVTGPKLHRLLVEKSSKTENWLSDDWWMKKAYLEGRDTIMVWSNPGLICPRIDVPSGRNSTIRYISNLILGALDFRSFLASGGNPEPGVSGQCMRQYERVFGTTRIPGTEVDSIKFGQLDCSNDLSIVISRHGNFYKVTLPKIETQMDVSNLSRSMEVIIERILSENQNPGKIGALTALPRTKWAELYQKLDQNSVNSILESQFVVSIDHIENKKEFLEDWSNSMARQVLHSDSINIGNRWFDKTIQLIVVLSNGGNQVLGSGLCYEHTPAEGPPIVRLMEHAMKYLVKQSASATSGQSSGDSGQSSGDSGQSSGSSLSLQKLSFDPSSIKSGLSDAVTFHNDLTKSLDLQVLEFTEFGKEMIKSFKVSPDSFIQVAINWAYYRVHKTTVACYESASTRSFVNGRTECIRSVTPEFFHFSKHPSLPALKDAIDAHKNAVNRAMTGNGIDRLLLGLNAAAQEVTQGTWKWSHVSTDTLGQNDLRLLQRLYQHELFIRSKYFSISTSQVPTIFPDSFMIYGPLTNEGYGCCYNPARNGITFGISAFNDFAEEPCTTSAIRFKQALAQALIEMRDMIMSTSAKL